MGKKRHINFFGAWRQRSGMTLEAVEEATGISVSRQSRLESGEVRFNQDHLESLAVLYGCEPAQLVAGPPSETASNIVRLVNGRSVREQQRIYRVVEAMVDEAQAAREGRE